MDINDVNWSIELDGEHFELNVDGDIVQGCHWKCQTDPEYVILFFHGLASNMEFNANFTRVFPSLHASCLATDHVGNGFSMTRTSSEGTTIAQETTTVDQIVDEIIELITYARKIYPTTPMFLMGHSLGGLSLLYLACNKKDKEKYDFITQAIKGIIVHGPWIDTDEKRKPGFLKLTALTMMAYVYPTYKIDSGLKIQASKYPDGYKQAALSSSHINPYMSARLLNSVFKAQSFVQDDGGDSYPDSIPLFFMQRDDDDCVNKDANIAWAAKLAKSRNKDDSNVSKMRKNVSSFQK